mgnify:FL=1
MAVSKLREPGRTSVGRAVLYVELARPAAVAVLVRTLDETIEPITVTDKTYGEHKRWDNGLIMIEDFVSEAEERSIMEGILAEDGWHSDLTKRQSVSFVFWCYGVSSKFSIPSDMRAQIGREIGRAHV